MSGISKATTVQEAKLTLAAPDPGVASVTCPITGSSCALLKE